MKETIILIGGGGHCKSCIDVVEQEGRFQRYRANIQLMSDLIAYLAEECCNGHPEHCLET